MAPGTHYAVPLRAFVRRRDRMSSIVPCVKLLAVVLVPTPLKNLSVWQTDYSRATFYHAMYAAFSTTS